MPLRSYSLPPAWPLYSTLTRRRRPDLAILDRTCGALRALRIYHPASETLPLLDALYAILAPSAQERLVLRALLLDAAAQRPRIADALNTRNSDLRATARALYSRLAPHLAHARACEASSQAARTLRSFADLPSL